MANDMTAVKIAIAAPIVVGAVMIGSVIASVPPEDRPVQWPVFGGISVIGLIAAVILLRRSGAALPPSGNRISSTGAKIIPFARAA